MGNSVSNDSEVIVKDEEGSPGLVEGFQRSFQCECEFLQLYAL